MTDTARSYLVMAYRWGWTNAHQYPVYCGPYREKALSSASEERDDRGGKYGCAVYEFDGEGKQRTLIAYFPSIMEPEERAPRHNWRLNYFERLGQFAEDYADGRVLIPEPEDATTLKSVDVEPPQLLKDAVARAQHYYEEMEKVEAEIRAQPGKTAQIVEAPLKLVELEIRAHENEPVQMNAEFRGAAVKVLASHFVGWFEQAGAQNYITVDIIDPETGERYTITMQKAGGKTPAEEIRELRAAVQRYAQKEGA